MLTITFDNIITLDDEEKCIHAFWKATGDKSGADHFPASDPRDEPQSRPGGWVWYDVELTKVQTDDVPAMTAVEIANDYFDEHTEELETLADEAVRKNWSRPE